MKLRQQLYESKDSGNEYIKVNNSSSLCKNLRNIRHRKNLFLNNLNTEVVRKKNVNYNEEYYLKKENQLMSKILKDIKSKEVRPIVNTERNEIINNNFQTRQKHKRLDKIALKKENEKFKKRLDNQKPFIYAKNLEKEYKDFNNKFNNKKKANKSIILPNINDHK